MTTSERGARASRRCRLRRIVVTVLAAATMGATACDAEPPGDPERPTATGWNQVADRVDTTIRIAATHGSPNIAIRRTDGSVSRAQGHPGPWRDVDPIPEGATIRKLIEGNDNHLYALSDRGIFTHDGSSWQRIGEPADDLIGGTGRIDGSAASTIALYAEHRSANRLLRYGGQPGQWTDIGERGAMYAETGSGTGARLYRLSVDRSTIDEFSGTPHRWRRVGGPADSIFGGPGQPGRLWLLAPGTGAIAEYNGTGHWIGLATSANDPFRAQPGGRIVFGSSSSAYYLSPNRNELWAYRLPAIERTDTVMVRRWVKLSSVPLVDIFTFGRTVGLNTNNELLALLPDGRLSLYTWPEVSILTDSLPHGTVTRQYLSILNAGGGTGPYYWSLYTDTPPPGIRLTPDGQLSGWANEIGTWAFNIQVIDSSGSVARRALSITVDRLPAGNDPSPPPPPAAMGYSDVRWYNCLADRGSLHVWVSDVTAGTGWQEAAGSPASALYNSAGGCPAEDRPLTVELTDGHIYEIAAVAPSGQLCGGRNDPTQLGCRRDYVAIRGATGGPNITRIVA